MKKAKKLMVGISLIIFILLCITTVIIISPYMVRDVKGKKNVERCRLLKAGMTRNQVLDIMKSPPFHIRGKGLEEIWHYSEPVGASTAPCVTFDKKTGKVIDIVCDDAGSILFEKTNHIKEVKDNNLKNIEKIKAGMTDVEIVGLLGAPEKVVEEQETGTKKHYYSILKLPAVFDVKNNKLICLILKSGYFIDESKNIRTNKAEYEEYRRKEIAFGKDKVLKLELQVEEYREKRTDNVYIKWLKINYLDQNKDLINLLVNIPKTRSLSPEDINKGVKAEIYSNQDKRLYKFKEIYIMPCNNTNIYFPAYFDEKRGQKYCDSYYYEEDKNIRKLSMPILTRENGNYYWPYIKIVDIGRKREAVIINDAADLGGCDLRIYGIDMNMDLSLMLKQSNMHVFAITDMDNDGNKEIVSSRIGRMPAEFKNLYEELCKAQMIRFPEFYSEYTIYKLNESKNIIEEAINFVDVAIESR